MPCLVLPVILWVSLWFYASYVCYYENLLSKSLFWFLSTSRPVCVKEMLITMEGANLKGGKKIKKLMCTFEKICFISIKNKVKTILVVIYIIWGESLFEKQDLSTQRRCCLMEIKMRCILRLKLLQWNLETLRVVMTGPAAASDGQHHGGTIGIKTSSMRFIFLHAQPDSHIIRYW